MAQEAKKTVIEIVKAEYHTAIDNANKALKANGGTMKKDPIDLLLEEYVRLMPETAYLMKNPDRYPVVEKAAHEIANMALKCDEDAKIEIYPDELTGSTLCLKITADILAMDMLDKFCESLKVANSFETGALTNGQVFMAITFEDAWVPAPSANDETK